MTSIVENTTYLSHYCIFSNKAAEDPNLSWAAKGLLVYLISRGPNWKIHVWQLAKVYQGEAKGNSRDAVRNLLKELRDAGYVRYEKFQDEQGKWNHRYKAYPEPIEEFKKKFPQTDDPALDNPTPADPSIRTITELTITDLDHPPLSPPVNEPKKVEQQGNIATREDDELKIGLLKDINLSDFQRRRLLIYPLAELERALRIAQWMTPKKGLINLLIHILCNPNQYDEPEEHLTEQQRLALKHNRLLRHNGYTKIADENETLIREKHCMKAFLATGQGTTLSLKGPLQVLKEDLDASERIQEIARRHRAEDKAK